MFISLLENFLLATSTFHFHKSSSESESEDEGNLNPNLEKREDSGDEKIQK